MLTTAELRAAIRELAKVDTRHSFLRPDEDGGATDGWYDRRGYIILVELDRDSVPLVGVMLQYPSECPEDRTYIVQIKYWLFKLDAGRDVLDAAFKASVQSIYDYMGTIGEQRVWGPVPMNAPHLTSRLNPIAASGKCETAAVEGVPGKKYFLGNRTIVNTEVQA